MPYGDAVELEGMRADQERAWAESETKDVTNGATMWENIGAFGRPKWADKMEIAYSYKDHIFFREVRK